MKSAYDSALRFLLMLGAACLAAGTDQCSGHPSSHVDAWINVDETLRVRLTLFLDDVLSFQNVPETAPPSIMPATNVRQALQNFRKALPKLLTIYNPDGTPVIWESVVPPVWTPDESGVDLQADANLRLTWQLQCPWNAAQQTLSLQHRFVRHTSAADLSPPPSVVTDPQPAELRIRLRCAGRSGRISANVVSHNPHTIVLPATGSEFRRQQDEVALTAHLTLLPGQLVHEVSLPLSSLLQRFMPEHPASRTTLDLHEQTELQRQLTTWARHHLQVSTATQVLPTETTTVELLNAQLEQLQEQTNVPVIGSCVGIRTVHLLSETPVQVTARFRELPAASPMIQLHTYAPHASVSQLLNGTPPGDSTAAKQELTYTWSVPDQTPLPPAAAVRQDADWPAVDLWETRKTVPDGLRTTLWLLLGLCGITLIAGKIRQRSWLYLCVLLTAPCLGTVLWNTSPRTVLQTAAAETLVERMLTEIYLAVSSSHDAAAVASLSRILTDDLAESVYAECAAGLAEANHHAPLVRLDEVRLHQCHVTGFTPAQSANLRCLWLVRGEILHWGHRHERVLRLQGHIQVRETPTGPRIARLQPESLTVTAETTE